MYFEGALNARYAAIGNGNIGVIATDRSKHIPAFGLNMKADVQSQTCVVFGKVDLMRKVSVIRGCGDHASFLILRYKRE